MGDLAVAAIAQLPSKRCALRVTRADVNERQLRVVRGLSHQISTQSSYNRFSYADDRRDALERWGAFVDRLVHRSAFHLYLIGRRTDKDFNHMNPGDSVCATRVEEILEADH